jgi:hypothetical protein
MPSRIKTSHPTHCLKNLQHPETKKKPQNQIIGFEAIPINYFELLFHKRNFNNLRF